VDANAALNELRQMPPGEASTWFEGRQFPLADHWWSGFFGTLETCLSPFNRLPRTELLHLLRIGAECVEVAAQRDDVPFTLVGYWAIRLAHATLRYEPPLVEVFMLTPGGAVAWFFGGLQYSAETVLVAARTLSAADPEADEDPPIYPRRGRLAEIHSALDLAEPLAAHIHDAKVRRELSLWLEVREEIFGPSR